MGFKQGNHIRDNGETFEITEVVLHVSLASFDPAAALVQINAALLGPLGNKNVPLFLKAIRVIAVPDLADGTVIGFKLGYSDDVSTMAAFKEIYPPILSNPAYEGVVASSKHEVIHELGEFPIRIDARKTLNWAYLNTDASARVCILTLELYKTMLVQELKA